MKLKSVSAVNIKHETFTIDLTDMTFVVGANFRGKSARLEAITLVLLGYVPALGKTNQATFGLCSGKELIVEGEFDTGERIKRRWWLKGDSVKSESILPPGFDDAKQLVAVMMDVDAYLGLGPTERTDFIFANIAGLGEEFSREALWEAVQIELFQTEGIKSKDADKIVARIESMIAERERNPAFTGWTPQTYVDELALITESERKGAKTKATVMEKGVQALAHLRAQDQPAGPDIAALDATHRRLTDELTALREERARLNAAVEQARATKRRRDELTSQLRELPALKAQREARKSKIEAGERDLANVIALTNREFDALAEEERTASFAHREHVRQAAEVDASLVRNRAEQSAVGAKTQCPYCGATGDGWKTLRLSEYDSAISGLLAKKRQLETHVAQLDQHAKALAARVTKEKAARELRAKAERDLAAEKGALSTIERNLGILEERQKQLDALPDAAVNADELDKAAQKIAEKQDEVNACDAQRRAILGRGAELQRLAQAETARDEATSEEAVAKVAEEIVAARREAMVAAAFRPLLETANAFFPDILRNALAFHKGEIGWWDAGLWVAHKTFSGTEKALAYAAIQAALASRAPLRIMLIDELGRLDEANSIKFAHDVGMAIARGDLAQFVGVDSGRADLYEAHRSSDLPLSVQRVERSDLE
jgi:hypothetical protein